MNTAFIAEFV